VLNLGGPFLRMLFPAFVAAALSFLLTLPARRFALFVGM
jgi:hypothetical protein